MRSNLPPGVTDYDIEAFQESNDTDKLKPCPFCGSDQVECIKRGIVGWHWVVCWNCGTDGPRGATDSYEAIEMWNDRKGENDAPQD